MDLIPSSTPGIQVAPCKSSQLIIQSRYYTFNNRPSFFKCQGTIAKSLKNKSTSLRELLLVLKQIFHMKSATNCTMVALC